MRLVVTGGVAKRVEQQRLVERRSIRRVRRCGEAAGARENLAAVRVGTLGGVAGPRRVLAMAAPVQFLVVVVVRAAGRSLRILDQVPRNRVGGALLVQEGDRLARCRGGRGSGSGGRARRTRRSGG